MTLATLQSIELPDIGDFDQVDIIEILVKPGDQVNQDDPLITLETDKATMEVPAPSAGNIAKLYVKVGDKISKGDVILDLEESDQAGTTTTKVEPATQAITEPTKQSKPKRSEHQTQTNKVIPQNYSKTPIAPNKMTIGKQLPYASPTIRKFATELGVDLNHVTGSGRKNRITKEDVQQFVKQQLNQPNTNHGLGITPLPAIDFSKFGEVTAEPLSRIKKISGPNLHRNWVTIPHVTQFDQADITELEKFRKNQLETVKAQGVKLTLLAFLIKACVHALKTFPTFNASLDVNGENLMLKQYFHIGVAVDTPDGLVVPVIRNCDQKSLVSIAKELGTLSQKARDKKLSPAEMQGGCFSISSLGGLGGTAFTPIINAPEVAILGVSRSQIQAQYIDNQFQPRLMLPLSLSYDHRVIDGALAARFTRALAELLSDIRCLLL